MSNKHSIYPIEQIRSLLKTSSGELYFNLNNKGFNKDKLILINSGSGGGANGSGSGITVASSLIHLKGTLTEDALITGEDLGFVLTTNMSASDVIARSGFDIVDGTWTYTSGVWNDSSPMTENDKGTSAILANNSVGPEINRVMVGQFGVQMANQNAGGTNKLEFLVNGTMIITDSQASKGFIYDADYSGNFTARSLVDKGYVDSVVLSQTAGTFTPTLSFGGGSTGIVYVSQTAQWVKMGTLVWVSIYIKISSKGTDTGEVSIGTLAHSLNTTNIDQAFSAKLVNTNTSTDKHIGCYVLSGGTTFTLFTGNTRIDEGDLGSSSEFTITGTFRTT